MPGTVPRARDTAVTGREAQSGRRSWAISGSEKYLEGTKNKERRWTTKAWGGEGLGVRESMYEKSI